MISKPSAAIPPYHSVWGAEEKTVKAFFSSASGEFSIQKKPFSEHH